MMHEAQEDAGSVKPFGLCLSEARQSLSLTLEELSETLNLDIGILRALEKSAIDELPPAIYVQGYIKAYTKALGISSEKIHEDYLRSVNQGREEELKPRSPLPNETNSGSPIVKMFSMVLLLTVIAASLFGVYSYYSGKLVIDKGVESSRETNFIPVAIAPKHEVVVVTQNAEMNSDGELVVGESQTSVANNIPVETMVGEPEESLEENAVIPDVQVDAQQDILIIKTTAKSWAEIRDANQNVLYLDNLKKDDFLILKGNAPFDVFFGNAPSVEIEVNEIEVDMSDYVRMNNVAHFKVSEKSNQIIFH